MNTKEIAEEINNATSTPEMRLKSDVDVIQAILDRHLKGKVVVPREPTMKMENAGWLAGADPEDIYKAMIAEAEKGD